MIPPSLVSSHCDPPAVAALLVTPDRRYLLQLRDDKPDIWFPGFWGLFGGGVDAGETPEEALRRELHEELGFQPGQAAYFTQVCFDLRRWGRGVKLRYVFEVPIEMDEIATMTLREGAGMELFAAPALGGLTKLAPYDALAIGLHVSQAVLAQAPIQA